MEKHYIMNLKINKVNVLGDYVLESLVGNIKK